MLQLRHFSKTYQGRAVLRIAGFDFAPGAYWIQGANSSGKSTLLRAIAEVTPFEGNIVLAGRRLRQPASATCSTRPAGASAARA